MILGSLFSVRSLPSCTSQDHLPRKGSFLGQLNRREGGRLDGTEKVQHTPTNQPFLQIATPPGMKGKKLDNGDEYLLKNKCNVTKPLLMTIKLWVCCEL